MDITHQDAGAYEFEDIIGIAGRENNAKRNFLLVNRLQGKYAPAVPRESIRMFHSLGKLAAAYTQGQKAAVIGFAETATALGAFAAEAFGADTYYLHTTRQDAEGLTEVVAFEEEHSHATSHRLYCASPETLAASQWVVLVDDEFTTGKTVCNIVDGLKSSGQLAQDVRFLAASVLNGMNAADLQAFAERGIECVWLIRREDLAGIAVQAGGQAEDAPCSAEREGSFRCQEIKEGGRPALFCGVHIGEYRRACESFAGRVIGNVARPQDTGRILVVGTEECMYPAILFGELLQTHARAASVRVQATGRSPILVNRQEGYPIYSRKRIASAYDSGRDVFLYNLEKYDRVFVITDAPEDGAGCFSETVAALREFGNDDITIVRWGI